MKLVFQIAAGILLASLVQWLLVVMFAASAFRIDADDSKPSYTTPRDYDSSSPCAHLDPGSSVREWCENKEAEKK